MNKKIIQKLTSDYFLVQNIEKLFGKTFVLNSKIKLIYKLIVPAAPPY